LREMTKMLAHYGRFAARLRTPVSSILKWFRILLSIFGLAFFLYALAQIRWGDLAESLVSMLLLIPVLWLSLWLNANAFANLIDLRATVSRAAMRLLFLEAWIARYVPGPSQLASKTVGLKNAGLNNKEVARQLFADLALTIGATACFGLAFAIAGSSFGLFLKPPLWHLSLLLLPLLTLSLIAVKRFLLVPNLAFSYFLVSRFTYALGVCLFVHEVTGLRLDAIFALTGLYLLSVVVGHLAIVVPGGIGVREGFFILILTEFMSFGLGSAAVIAAGIRASTLFSDSGVFLYLFLMNFRRRKFASA